MDEQEQEQEHKDDEFDVDDDFDRYVEAKIARWDDGDDDDDPDRVFARAEQMNDGGEADAPAASAIHVSTKTILVHLNHPLDLHALFWHVELREYFASVQGVLKKEIKFVSDTPEQLATLLSSVARLREEANEDAHPFEEHVTYHCDPHDPEHNVGVGSNLGKLHTSVTAMVAANLDAEQQRAPDAPFNLHYHQRYGRKAFMQQQRHLRLQQQRREQEQEHAGDLEEEEEGQKDAEERGNEGEKETDEQVPRQGQGQGDKTKLPLPVPTGGKHKKKKDRVFKDVRKVSVGMSSKDLAHGHVLSAAQSSSPSPSPKRKKAMSNCLVFVLRLWIQLPGMARPAFREFHVKVFNSGKLEIPGILHDCMVEPIVQAAVRAIQPHVDAPLAYDLNRTETVLINSDFRCNYMVNRNALYHVLTHRYHIPVIYETSSYPGLQCKFYYNPAAEVAPGEFIARVDRHVCKTARKITFMVFRTGSVLIVGRCNETVLHQLYEWLTHVLRVEYRAVREVASRTLSSDRASTVHKKHKAKKPKRVTVYVPRKHTRAIVAACPTK